MNNRIQSPLMLALESGNYILVDYLINKAKVDITADISHDGKCLLHYFAIKCTEYDLIQTLIKLVSERFSLIVFVELSMDFSRLRMK